MSGRPSILHFLPLSQPLLPLPGVPYSRRHGRWDTDDESETWCQCCNGLGLKRNQHWLAVGQLSIEDTCVCTDVLKSTGLLQEVKVMSFNSIFLTIWDKGVTEGFPQRDAANVKYIWIRQKQNQNCFSSAPLCWSQWYCDASQHKCAICTAVLLSVGRKLLVTPVSPCKPLICLVRVLEGCANSLYGGLEKSVHEYYFPSPRRADSSVGDDAKYMLHLEAGDRNCGHWVLSVCQLTIV